MLASVVALLAECGFYCYFFCVSFFALPAGSRPEISDEISPSPFSLPPFPRSSGLKVPKFLSCLSGLDVGKKRGEEKKHSVRPHINTAFFLRARAVCTYSLSLSLPKEF